MTNLLLFIATVAVSALICRWLPEKASYWVLATCLLLFLVSTVASVYTMDRFGGAAVYGKVEDGRYYLGNGGTFIPVTRSRYLLSAAFFYLWIEAMAAAFGWGLARGRRQC